MTTSSDKPQRQVPAGRRAGKQTGTAKMLISAASVAAALVGWGVLGNQVQADTAQTQSQPVVVREPAALPTLVALTTPGEVALPVAQPAPIQAQAAPALRSVNRPIIAQTRSSR